jgi:hypothetical protein
MRFAMLLGVLGLLTSGCASAHAHTRPLTPSVSVSVGWTWVGGQWTAGHWMSGHWAHPHHGKSYRQHRHGPPKARPHHNARWVTGHWAGHGHHRHWVRGQWQR